MATSINGHIKAAAMKTDGDTGAPALEVKIDFGIADAEKLRGLVNLWRDEKAEVRVTFEPVQMDFDFAVGEDHTATVSVSGR